MENTMVTVNRCTQNPLILPSDVKPTRADLRVDGIFNCGVCKYKDEIILACRVAESVYSDDENIVKVPIVKRKDGKDSIDVRTIKKTEHPNWNFSDSRTISERGADGGKKIVSLTSLSHIRLARSKDGIHFTLEEKPCIFPSAEQEGWGMEDPRITQIGDTYYINYSAVNEQGPSTALVSTKDFESYTRHGIIFVSENKDVAIFSERIGSMYYALNRPFCSTFGAADIWLAESPDLVHWGNQKHLCGAQNDWENGRVGGGCPPLLTEKGWLVIYHAADQNNRYCLGAILLDKMNPSHILARSAEPIMQPEADYEKNGFFGEVIFTCGSLLSENNVIMYYGAADDKICRADIPLSEIYRALGVL